MNTIHTCPVCYSQRTQFVFNVKDYTVSQKEFTVWHCDDCQHRFTADIPSESEIGVYYQSEDYISHTNTQKGLVNRLYHIVRSWALKSKRNTIVKYSGKQQANLLDIGCGTGAFLNTMKLANWTVSGLEPDETARAQAQKNFNFLPESPDKLFAFAEESFDAITMWHVLEHVHKLHPYIAQIHKILKKDGVFFVAVPNYRSLDAEIYQDKWAAYDVPRHLYHFSPESMKTLLQKYGFQIIQHQAMPFDSFYVSLLSEKCKTGKTNLISGFWNGFKSYLQATRNPKRCSSILYIIKKA